MTTVPNTQFDPAKIRILKFAQTELPEEPPARIGITTRRYRYEVALQLGEARGAGFAVKRVTILADGNSIEPLTQHAVIRLFLDAITTAVEKEKAETRPGTP